LRAVVTDPDAPVGVAIADLPDPQPRANQALVAVRSVSLNRGEVGHIPNLSPGTLMGWDAAGVVVQQAADGSGPVVGERIFGSIQARGTWAERAAVPTRSLGVLPAGVSFAAGSALPVAGGTALQALRHGGDLLGKQVLVTGAAGGVGRIAVQLAARSGADVTAVVGSAERAEAVDNLDLTRVHTEIGMSAEGSRADLILESAGGDSLTAAFDRVAPGGTIVTYGRSSGQPGQVPPGWFYQRARLVGLTYTHGPTGAPTGPPDLALLADLVARGWLDPGVSLEAPWEEIDSVVRALVQRQVAGKAVLHVDGSGAGA
jgi:NADPH:quinone reductase-like Zn-dependent oxidoreductase